MLADGPRDQLLAGAALAGDQDGDVLARDAADRRDASRLREAAHELRGLLSTFSAMAAAEAVRLETMGTSGRLDDAASTLDGLTEMVERLGP
jgi:two-component system, sensor histidine kinase and response regulator